MYINKNLSNCFLELKRFSEYTLNQFLKQFKKTKKQYMCTTKYNINTFCYLEDLFCFF